MNAFQIHGETIQFFPDGAIFLPDHGALIVADVHLGKSATFRARGLPVPEGDTSRDLIRLATLVQQTQATRLIVAGDLFHAPAGITQEIEGVIQSFLDQLDIPFHLVGGNHDARLKRFPCAISPVESHDIGTLRIIHDPKDTTEDCLHLAGHWHPVVKIKDGGRRSLRLRCFLLRNRTLVLPSFGSFTGGAVIPLEPNDRAFVAIRENVIELPSQLLR